MNRKLIGFLLAVPALMGFGLTSCSDEVATSVKGTAQEKQIDVTLTAALPKGTRATLSPEKNVLKFKWEMDDVVSVVNAANGKWLGTLKVSKVNEDPSTCTFAGSISVAPGEVDLNFYYLGRGKGRVELEQDLTAKPYALDFSAQDGRQNFQDNDVLIAQAHYADASDGNLGIVDFSRHFAYGRFVLQYNGEDLDLSGKTVTISANTGTLHNATVLDLQNAEYTSTEGSIAVTSANNFYVTFLPSNEVNLLFTVDMGEMGTFVGAKGKELVSSLYYTANNDGDAIVVEMKRNDGSDDAHDFILKYAPNYAPTNDGVKEYTKNCVGSADYIVQKYDLFTREGWTLTGWNTEAEGTGNPYKADETLTITWPETTVTLYAQWAIDYKATLKYDGKEEEVRPNDGETSVDLPTLPDKGEEEFIGWKKEGGDDDDATKGPWEFTEEEPQVVLVPVYIEKKYEWTIQWKDDPAVGDVVYKTKLESGVSPHTLESTHPANPTKEGYKFLGWEYEGKMITSEKEVVMTADNLNPIIYAKWEKAKYDLVVNCWSNDGTDNKSVQTENHILPHTMYAKNWDVPTRTGYKFVGWGATVDATTPIELVTFTTPDAKNVYAIWKKDASNGNITAPGASGSDY